MQNLFLSFDSTSHLMYSLNWISVFIPLLFLNKFWLSQSEPQKLFSLMDKVLIKEIKTTFNLQTNNSGIFLKFIGLFNFIMIMNVCGLLPYIFTPTSHLVMTLFLSIPIWLGIQMVGWTLEFNKMACHLVPMSTPAPLIPFLVLIESLSNMIRPFTLAIRLTANMTAGHLLMCLLGSASSINALFILQTMVILTMIVLLILEISVAFIQSYVFMLLASLYTVESMIQD